MSNPSTNNQDLENAFKSYQENYLKFQNGNKSAGTRARKSLMEMSKISKLLRVEIQDSKNSQK